MNKEANKPPPIVIGAVGIQHDAYAADEIDHNWSVLVKLPKFQMFSTELSGMHYSSVMQWIDAYTHEQISKQGQQAYFAAYEKWHDEKGYWPNETVYGELKHNGP